MPFSQIIPPSPSHLTEGNAEVHRDEISKAQDSKEEDLGLHAGMPNSQSELFVPHGAARSERTVLKAEHRNLTTEIWILGQ